MRRMRVHVLQHHEGMMNACYSKNKFAGGRNQAASHLRVLGKSLQWTCVG